MIEVKDVVSQLCSNDPRPPSPGSMTARRISALDTSVSNVFLGSMDFVNSKKLYARYAQVVFCNQDANKIPDLEWGCCPPANW